MRTVINSKNHLTSDGERDNSQVFKFEKHHTLEKNSEFRVIVYCTIPKTITRNSESASFTGLLKSLLALWVLEEIRQTWPMFSELKALIDSERFRVIVFQYRSKNDNSELGIHLRMNSEISENSELSLWPCFQAKNRMCRHRPTKVVQAYQWLPCEKQVHCRPINVYFRKMKFHINFSVTFFKMEDGSLTKTTK